MQILCGILILLMDHLDVYASNILIWNPTIGHSHVTFLGNIADVLTDDGHNVTIFSPALDPHVETFGNRLPARTIRFRSPNVDADDWLKLEIKHASMWESPPCESVCFKWEDFDWIIEQMRKSCEGIVNDENLLSTLRESKFDLAYAECIDPCAPAVFEILEIKHVVMVSAFGMHPVLYDIAGLSPIPSIMPATLTPYSDEMTFKERFLNLKIEIELFRHFRGWDRIFESLMKTKYPAFPEIRQIRYEKTALIMVNVNEFAETPRPTTNMIQYIGGATLHDPKPLTKELDALLNKRSLTILFSMGSLAQSKDMPAWLKKDIIDAFSTFPNVTFIWKYEGDDILFKPHDNIYPMKWVPQTDLLADRRLSLFITHGGMNSMLEAMFHGKPMIVIPLFGDQQLNSRSIQKLGIGVLLEKHKLNKSTLVEALHKAIGNSDISRESAFVASLLDGRPRQYRSEIKKWARIIIEHGKMKHLILHSRTMNFLQYYSLDVIGSLCSIVLTFLVVMYCILKRLFASAVAVKLKSN